MTHLVRHRGRGAEEDGVAHAEVERAHDVAQRERAARAQRRRVQHAACLAIACAFLRRQLHACVTRWTSAR